jgi:methylmalonyl-CoA mutase N-terminal domain/subunit
VEARERITVGVNDFTIEEKQPPTLYIDESVAVHQSKKLKALKQRRDNDEVRRRLEALKRAAAQEPVVRADGRISDANTMPFIIDCVRAYATVGEVCEALREVYGTYEEVSIT